MTIMLKKGQIIPLVTEHQAKIEVFCIGANWEAIPSKGFFGGDKITAVDLDLSVVLLSKDKKPLDLVYHNNLYADGVLHSGDDLVGGIIGSHNVDHPDNEVISIKIKELSEDVHYISIVLNSYNKVDLKDVPFASMRIYEGSLGVVKEEFAKFEINNDDIFTGAYGMVLGAFRKDDDGWKFHTVGEPIAEYELEHIVHEAIDLL